jgi:predicted transcriptional regulator
VDQKITLLLQNHLNCRRFILLCFILLFLISTANATEYIVSPAPDEQFGVPVNGENEHIFEDTVEPYWQFLLWLAAMNILSAIDMLYQTKLIFALAGCRIVDQVNVLDNPCRSKVYTYIKTRPGAYISEIVERIGLDRGSVKYHIKTLEDQNKIEAYRDGGKTRYFENNFTYNEEEMKVISALQNGMNQKIISEILTGKCDTNVALAREFRVSKATVSWYVRNLKEIGLIKKKKKGRSIIYRINSSYILLIEKYGQDNMDFYSKERSKSMPEINHALEI